MQEIRIEASNDIDDKVRPTTFSGDDVGKKRKRDGQRVSNSRLITFLPSKGRSKFVIRASSATIYQRRNTNRAFYGKTPSSLRLSMLHLDAQQRTIVFASFGHFIVSTALLFKDPHAFVCKFQFKKLKSSTRRRVRAFLIK